MTISGKHWKRVTAKILTCTLKNTSGWFTVLRLPHSLRLFSFVFVSNPKFHVKLSNTLLYNYWKVARVADNSVLIRLVFAKQHSKVSVLVGAHWERSWVLPVRLSMQRVTKRESKTAERPTANFLCTVLHCCLGLSLTCKVKVHCAWSESLWNNNSDMQTRKHQGWYTAFPLPPLSSSVFVFEPKVSSQTVKHTLLWVSTATYTWRWQELLKATFSYVLYLHGNILRFPYLWELTGNSHDKWCRCGCRHSG